MYVKGKAFDDIYDIMALRIITETEMNCYELLGYIHANFKPIPGRFKDYIAMPKPNMYQSLHTTIVTGDGHTFEIQIRTKKMDEIAEEGVAAHWRYKENKNMMLKQSNKKSKSNCIGSVILFLSPMKFKMEMPKNMLKPYNMISLMPMSMFYPKRKSSDSAKWFNAD